MFNIFGKQVEKCKIPTNDRPADPKDCTQDKRIKELESELGDYKRKYEKLNKEIEQGYVKDSKTFEVELWDRKTNFVWLEYIEKLGKTSIKIYTPELNPYCGASQKLLIEYERETCIAFRDFLLKHFPRGGKE